MGFNVKRLIESFVDVDVGCLPVLSGGYCDWIDEKSVWAHSSGLLATFCIKHTAVLAFRGGVSPSDVGFRFLLVCKFVNVKFVIYLKEKFVSL